MAIFLAAWLSVAIFFSRGDSAADVSQKTWLFVRGYFSVAIFSVAIFCVAIFGFAVAIFCFPVAIYPWLFFLRGYFCVAIVRPHGAKACDLRDKMWLYKAQKHATCLATPCLSTLLV